MKEKVVQPTWNVGGSVVRRAKTEIGAVISIIANTKGSCVLGTAVFHVIPVLTRIL